MTPLLLLQHLALGDTICFTALVRDIARAYPGRFQILVQSNWTRVWAHNPYIAALNPLQKPRTSALKISYRDGITEGNNGRKIHMLAWYHENFRRQTGLEVPVTFPGGDLHLTPEEREPRLAGRYWVVVAGGKLDMTIKHWGVHRYQEVVDTLLGYGIRCVQTGATHKDHTHTPLERVRNLVGHTEDVRDLFNLILHADGVIGSVSSAMHIAAALEKPYVVIAGGREAPWWEAYDGVYGAWGPSCPPPKVAHRFLHTVGLIHCCATKGCWRHRVIPIESRDLTEERKAKMCLEPIRKSGEAPVALCMSMIQPAHVVEAVMSYYESGEITPIAEPKGTYPKQPIPSSPPALPTVVRPPSVPVAAASPPPRERSKPPPSPLDHPLVGGRFTVCVLCYGDFPELVRRCLGTILNSLPRNRLDLRVATNAASAATLACLRDLPITKLYQNEENRFKYPVVREMFHDPDCPITTNYVVWFDDDSYVIDPEWATRLAESIIAHHPQGVRLYGAHCRHDLAMYARNGHRPDLWFREANWYQGVPLQAPQYGREIPNGSVIHFVAGGFLALGTDAIRLCDIPDRRLSHNGGDITYGEQIHQHGFKLVMFNKGKALVHTSAHARRGASQSFPWALPQ